MVGRQPYAPAAFTPGEIPDTHFQGLSRPQGKKPRKRSPVTPPGIDPGTVRLVAQRLNHYATPDPYWYLYLTLTTSANFAVISNMVLVTLKFAYGMKFRRNEFLQFLSETFLGAFAKLRIATINSVLSVCLSVRPSAKNRTPNGWVFIKFDI